MEPTPADAPLRIVLVEDEDLFRDLLRGVLEHEPDLEVVGSFGDADSALAVSPTLQPDVALLDIALGPGPSGIHLGLALRKRLPKLGIVILSQHADPHFVAALPQHAIDGWSYLLKRSVRERTVIVRALRGAARGEVMLDPELVASGQPRAGGLLVRLAPRQREILQLVAQGLTNAAIAERLVLAEKSVENQLTTIYEHLGIDRHNGATHSRVQAVLVYLRESQWDVGRPAYSEVGASPLTRNADLGHPYPMMQPRERQDAKQTDAAPGAGPPYRVLVVDDQPEFLRAARAVLGGDPRLMIVGEVASGREALSIFSDLAPDAVLLDVQMPGMTGFEAAQALRALAPRARIILTSTLEAAVYARTAARIGAAFLPKKQLSAQAVLNLLLAPRPPATWTAEDSE